MYLAFTLTKKQIQVKFSSRILDFSLLALVNAWPLNIICVNLNIFI